MNLSAAALDALKTAVADHRTVRVLPITDRAVYREVDRALSRLAGGGRWDRRERAHVYDQDPRPGLKELTGSGVIPAPMMTRDKEMSYWPTPPSLAARLVDGLDLVQGAQVLEPSAGDGALVRAIQETYPGVIVTAVEPDFGRRTVLRTNVPPGVIVWEETFEEFTDSYGGLFDAVVMNPPFTLPGHRYAWAEHLILAWGLLRPGGQLRAVVPSSLGSGRQRPIVKVRELFADVCGSWTSAPSGSFLPSGTGVNTLIVEATKGSCNT